MVEKYVTDEGKTEVLRNAFADDSGSPFIFFALGANGSNGATEQSATSFNEITDSTYHRVSTTCEVQGNESKKIILSGIFEEDNYNDLDNNITLEELSLCNSSEGDTTHFVICQIPNVPINGKVALKYNMVITTE